MLHFSCPQCQTNLRAALDQAGKSLRCPRCAGVVRAPSAGELAPLEVAEEADAPVTTIPPPVRGAYSLTESSLGTDLVPEWTGEAKQSNLRMLLIAVLIVGSVTICLAGGLILALRDGERKADGPTVASVVPSRPAYAQPARQRPGRQRELEDAPKREIEERPKTVPERPGRATPRLAPPRPTGNTELQPRPLPVAPKGGEPEPPPPDEPPTPVPGKLLREVVPGYETRLIEGFVVLLSTQAIKEAKKENGRPFKALEVEFAGLVEVLPPRALKVLRNIRIWVEWDNIDRSGRGVLAKYYGGNVWRLDPSEHILKSNAVELLSLKNLAREKTYAINRTRLVLLHELAHAVHHLLVGDDNADVAFAYKQAMDRRLYDAVLTNSGGRARAYAATNRFEYFAELTCAYLDHCNYFPFTREELAEHDPTGYRLMLAVWGPPAARQRATK